MALESSEPPAAMSCRHPLLQDPAPIVEHGAGENSFTLAGVGVHVDRLGTSEQRSRVARGIQSLPALVRALLAVEWGRGADGASCPLCGRARSDGHDPSCEVDAALSSAGFATAALREEARPSRRSRPTSE